MFNWTDDNGEFNNRVHYITNVTLWPQKILLDHNKSATLKFHT